MQPSPVEVVQQAEAILGEGPVWDARAGTLYWLDIKARALHAFMPATGHARTVPLALEVGAIAPRVAGGLIAATREGFATLESADGGLDFIADPESHLPGNRFNDGKLDGTGCFLAGSMDDSETEPTGSLYRLDADGSISTLLSGYIICNGPAFSPDGTTLYFSDTMARKILAFPYSPKSGAVSAPSLFARIPEDQGYPDGLERRAISLQRILLP